MITISTLNEQTGIRHGFFTRGGGVSQGLYTALNCSFGSADDPAAVAVNRARAMGMLDLPPEALVTVRQEHTAVVVTVDRPWTHGKAPRADALVTRVPGMALGVLSADCAPVLLADAQAGVIGAAHAGWRGAHGGVLASVVTAMQALGAAPHHVIATIGPCIAQRSYEVGPEFPAPFLDDDSDNAIFFAPANREGHYLFDLAGYVARRLAVLEVSTVVRTPCDTLYEEDRFFSYRRAVLRGEPDYGRGLSAIVLER
ncbi:MAG: hypothetical protein FD149_454 [Rhodospirillaceae bacterium]|nr:MAG: hypothetical protein FD149_454 [Rhodospirillaceae bacterium]